MAQVQVTMPKMGESITEGTVIAWHKQPGEAIELDETLLEIGTDKVDTEVPSPAAGTLVEILVEEGDTVEVDTAIAVIETDADAVGDVGSSAPEASPQPESGAEPEAEQAPQPEHARGDIESENLAQAMSGAAEHDTARGAVEDIVMPKMGESITEGTVIAWHKEPGEAIELDETLLEIGTDKVDTEVPSPAAGTLVEILVEEGDTVEVGSVIARIGVGDGAAAPAAQPSATPTAPAQADPPKTPESAPSTPSYQPAAQGGSPITRTSEDGRFFSPLVRSIAETEGLSMEELSQVPGSGREGRVSKDDLMAYLESRGAQQAPEQQADRQQTEARSAPAPAPAAQQPAARPAQQPVPQASGYGDRVEVQEMDRMRRIIADHMVRSKATSPHVTSFAEIDVTNLVRQREKNKRRVQEREGVKLTYTPYFIRAAVDAMRDHPLLNASVEGTRILIRKDFHVGMAVALGTTGLVAPVIRDAGSLNLVGLAKAAADLATRARDKKLQPDELSGGTFTVTNVGSLGSLMGTPIINQPQVAILSPGAIKKRPVVIEHPDLGDTIAIRHMMYVSLSYDHRIVDGAMAASYLRKYTDLLEGLDPGGEV